MRVIRFVYFLLVFTFFSLSLFSQQLTKIPQAAQDSFASKYPGAQNAKWESELIYLTVNFEWEGDKIYAEYSSKGMWRLSRKNWSYEKLPATVTDGFKKSKYADWPVSEVKIVSTPKDPELYRLTIEKNDIDKKNLFYNSEGRLIRESITW